MQLSIQSLSEMGSFTGAPVKKDIAWSQGDKSLAATIFVRPLDYHSATTGLTAKKGADPIAVRIASCICDEVGAPVFTPEDLTGEADPARGPIDGNLTVALLVAIGEVHGQGKTKSSAT